MEILYSHGVGLSNVRRLSKCMLPTLVTRLSNALKNFHTQCKFSIYLMLKSAFKYQQIFENLHCEYKISIH